MSDEESGIKKTVVYKESPRSMILTYALLRSNMENINDDMGEWRASMRRFEHAFGLIGSIKDPVTGKYKYQPGCKDVEAIEKKINAIKIPTVTVTKEVDCMKISAGSSNWTIMKGTETDLLPLVYSQIYTEPRLKLSAVIGQLDQILYSNGILHPTEDMESAAYVRMVDDAINVDDHIIQIAEDVSESTKTVDFDEVVKTVKDSLKEIIREVLAEDGN